MLRALPAPVIGALAFFAFIANTLFWLPLLLVVTALRLALPVPAVVAWCRRAAMGIAAAWIGFNVRGLQAVGRLQWTITEPADLRRDAWYVVTCNHRSWVDIVILQWLFNRRIPMLKFFLKKELLWVPLLGLAWWALEFPFMKRYSRAVVTRRPELRGKDLETTRRACEGFRKLPVSVLNFLEGTRFSEAKRDQQGSPYRHLLLPRAGGVAQVVSSLGDRLRSLLDVTIVYPRGTPTFWHLISGQLERVYVHVEEVALDASWTGRDYENDAEFREAFQRFLAALWQRKDERIGLMLSAAAAADPPA